MDQFIHNRSLYMFSIHTLIYIYLQQYVQKLEGYLQ